MANKACNEVVTVANMPMTVFDMISAMQNKYAGRVAFRYVEGKDTVVEKTYAQYVQDIRKATGYLQQELGKPKGKKIVILSRTNYEYGAVVFGTMMAGAVIVTLNQGKTWAELEYELGMVEPDLIFNDGIDYGYRAQLEALYGARLRPMDAWTAAPEAEMVNRIDHEGLLMLMFTSGTTGRSKGVMLSQKNLFSAMPAFLDPFDDVKKYTGWNTDEFSSLSALPMFHISAMTSLVSWSITGHSINLCNNLKYFYRDLGAMHSEVMAVVPVLLKSIYSDVMKGRRDRLNGLCVLTCGAAMFDPKILSDMMEKGFFVAQMYGLTETCGDGAWNSSQEAKYLTSVGHVDLSCEYKLDDGELCMRGNPIMLGYYKDPEGTAEVIDADGWFHTGDIARVEEDGYMYLTGRKKNLIILDSGENVSPEELEKLLVPCADIQECIVKEKDKKICALIYCDPAKQDAVKEFVTGVNRGLPLYKRMVTEFSAQPLPRNAMGKLLR